MWNFWKEIFNENFLKVGVMFWGDLFYDFLIFLIKEEVWVFLIKIVSINFDYVEIEGLFDELRKFKIKIYLMVNEREGLQVGVFRGLNRKWDKKKKINFIFDIKLYNSIKLIFFEIYKFFCVLILE